VSTRRLEGAEEKARGMIDAWSTIALLARDQAQLTQDQFGDAFAASPRNSARSSSLVSIVRAAGESPRKNCFNRSIFSALAIAGSIPRTRMCADLA
jgi:hypothetical protein